MVLWLWTRELGRPNESEKGSSKGASERKKPLLLLEGAHPLLYIKGMALQVRVRMLLSIVAHAGGYKIMVGAYNTIDVTVECQMHVRGCVCLLQEW